MTSPNPHAPPLLSMEPGGHLFDGAEYRYTFVAPLLDDEESNPVAIARRTPLEVGGKAELVLLKQVVLPPENERRQRATEELRRPLGCTIRTSPGCSTWRSTGTSPAW
ncbi:hypothetical protein ACN28S_37560 [Cystobacter fuscus]